MICATNACERMVELTYPVSNPDRFGEATRMIEDTWIIMMRWAAAKSSFPFPFQKQVRFIITTSFASSSGFFLKQSHLHHRRFGSCQPKWRSENESERRCEQWNGAIPLSSLRKGSAVERRAVEKVVNPFVFHFLGFRVAGREVVGRGTTFTLHCTLYVRTHIRTPEESHYRTSVPS